MKGKSPPKPMKVSSNPNCTEECRVDMSMAELNEIGERVLERLEKQPRSMKTKNIHYLVEKEIE